MEQGVPREPTLLRGVLAYPGAFAGNLDSAPYRTPGSRAGQISSYDLRPLSFPPKGKGEVRICSRSPQKTYGPLASGITPSKM